MAVIDDLQTAVAGYAAALAADSLNPTPTYSIDGQSVSRTEWREAMLRMVTETQKVINAMSPFIVSTKHTL